MNANDYKGFYGRYPGLFFLWIFLLSLLIARMLYWLDGA
jgi:hypothetical protein